VGGGFGGGGGGARGVVGHVGGAGTKGLIVFSYTTFIWQDTSHLSDQQHAWTGKNEMVGY